VKVIRHVKAMKEALANNKKKKIGFVPTMGYLHDGHLSLVDVARKENDLVVMSIFVNPLQFGPTEDLATYPRDEKHDTELAKKHGVDILFIPDVKEMYPDHFSIEMKLTTKTNVLCGKSRPGHFDGVITVLTKLFHIVEPTNAYFGLKDAQQFSVVDTLIHQLNFPIHLVGLPTVRERDGLAKSSRNVYLNDQERKDALVLYDTLKLGKQLVTDGTTVPSLKDELTKYLTRHCKGKVDYLEILSFPQLEEVHSIESTIIIAIAVHFDRARLIDNIILHADGTTVNRIG